PTLAPDGLTVTVVPTDYQQGQTYNFTIVAKNRKGVAGNAQTATFSTVKPASAYASPDNNASNIGVALPLTLTLSDPPADRNDLVSHLSLSASVNQPAPPTPSPAASPTPSSGDVCSTHYAPPAGAASAPLDFKPVWITSTRVRLVPKTPDGYWPADSTITLKASLTGVKTQAGNWVPADLGSSFTTADKRVIAIHLSNQQPTAC